MHRKVSKLKVANYVGRAHAKEIKRIQERILAETKQMHTGFSKRVGPMSILWPQ